MQRSEIRGRRCREERAVPHFEALQAGYGPLILFGLGKPELDPLIVTRPTMICGSVTPSRRA
jgi:hypothetical protein